MNYSIYRLKRKELLGQEIVERINYLQKKHAIINLMLYIQTIVEKGATIS